ncbi:hypothetical protein CKM354_000757900 [Cercospora kikuchii]|uniref:Cytochrome P450 monooxygenase n=1 Tax=Cercospora kikuchii TaxID=84275 RepID=A0A9P3CKG6_9PEZI|nr:uncharacterized protein CKM354_000757900 [Cercospora kikuchii]GIZ44381.1 hypothetical protein CKM354_000757900 [Cercospora kikuchii]
MLQRHPLYVYVSFFGLCLVVIIFWSRRRSAAEKYVASLPLVSVDGVDPKQAWATNARVMIEKGLREHSGPFRIMTSTGIKIVVRHQLTEEFTRSKSISGVETLRIDGFADYPGFEAAQVAISSPLLRSMLVHRLSPSLDIIRNDLRDEIEVATQEILGDSPNWASKKVSTDFSALAARLISRVLVGTPLCYNQQWVDVTNDYTLLSFTAASELRRTHWMLRPILHWFMDSCRSLRRTANKARSQIASELKRRETMENGPVEKPDASSCRSDGLHWLSQEIQESNSKADVAAAVLHLSLIGVQTTTFALSQVRHFEISVSEIVTDRILRQCVFFASIRNGLHSSLYEMRQIDSFLNESQRLSMGYLSMNSVAIHDVTFSDGTKIAKGACCVLESKLLDDKTYPSPNEFDPNRFLQTYAKPQQPALPKPSFVATSVEHLGFGFGLRTCPGRFLAADIMKMLLAYLVLNYDWQLDPSEDHPMTMEIESMMILHPEARMKVRKTIA